MKRAWKTIFILGLLAVAWPIPVSAMHIMEGFLPPVWSIAWGVLCLPFLVVGTKKLSAVTRGNPRVMMLVAMAGAYAFVLSALKLPSVTGSCSHPTGVGLGAVLFGPSIMSVLGLIVLLFQAILLAHGGLTTLGANAFSMAVMGPLVSWLVYVLLTRRWKRSPGIGIFFACTLGNLATYVMTSVQLAFAFPDPTGGFAASMARFSTIFAVTQIPLAIIEGLLSLLVFSYLKAYGGNELQDLNVISETVS